MEWRNMVLEGLSKRKGWSKEWVMQNKFNAKGKVRDSGPAVVAPSNCRGWALAPLPRVGFKVLP